jgi:hypothetical protein
MEYQLKNDSVEAWQIGSEPVPDWVAELIVDKTIRDKVDTGAAFSIATDDGPQNANAGDYIVYHPTVWGEQTPDAPQGEILAYRSVKLISQLEFQKLYDVPSSELPAAPAVDENALVGSGEGARPLSDSEKDQIDTQPAAAEHFEPIDPVDLQPFAADDAIDSQKPKRKR